MGFDAHNFSSLGHWLMVNRYSIFNDGWFIVRLIIVIIGLIY